MKLIKILSDRIQIKTDNFEFTDVRINDLIAVTDGKVTLITVVTSLMDTDTSSSPLEGDYISIPESIKVIESSIIGSVNNGKFTKAVDMYPTTNIKAFEVSPDDFKELIGINDEEGFHIGVYSGYNCPAFVDGNKFYQRHACIVGNTGSGKSETVAKILEETSKLRGANIIVFDIHGEYSNLSYSDNIKVGDEASFPIWMFGFSEMVTNILKIREESASVTMAALRKCYNKICPNGNENKPSYFSFSLLIQELELLNIQEVFSGDYYKTGDRAGQQKTTKGEYNGKLTSVLNTLKSKMLDKRYSFLFEEKSQNYLIGIIERILGSEYPVKNIDLSSVPHDVAIPIIGVVTKLVYEIKKSAGTSINPLTFVCDEAHVYIPNNFQLSASERRMVEIFENIAKEGRKFGVTLFPASQRPSELNKTIMAQCANFIVSKLNNENDKSMIKGMLTDGNESVIDSTTMFSPGDVLIIGDAVPIPLKIHVDLAKERPQSRTVEFWEEWKARKEIDFSYIISDYMKD